MKEDLLLKNGDPVDAREPAVFLDVVDAVLEVAEPLGEVSLQQAPYQVLHVGTEVRRKSKLHQTNATHLMEMTGQCTQPVVDSLPFWLETRPLMRHARSSRVNRVN